jgi:hypothetical protein
MPYSEFMTELCWYVAIRNGMTEIFSQIVCLLAADGRNLRQNSSSKV